jgi:hypothetical protein
MASGRRAGPQAPREVSSFLDTGEALQAGAGGEGLADVDRRGARLVDRSAF